MAVETIQVPDIGDEQDVEVIEILVSPGDEVSENDSLITLESDKAAMEIPSPKAGVIKEVLVKIGDQVSQGSAIVSMDTAAAAAEPESAPEQPGEETPAVAEPADPPPAPVESAAPGAEETGKADNQTAIQEIRVPDLGGDSDVDVIDILVAEGDEINKEDGLVTLESDKAAMDVPSPAAGKVVSIKLKVGDKVSEGSLILELETAGADTAAAASPQQEQASAETAADETRQPAAAATPAPGAEKAQPAPAQAAVPAGAADGSAIYAGPAVRRLARELGVDLSQVGGSGARGRIVKEDVQAFVKTRMQGGAATAPGGGIGLPGIDDIDFSRFGEIEEVELPKLHRLTAQNMTRNWLNVPHVTQFDEADITELEDFREAQKARAENKGVKLTPLPFIVKACARVLQEYPQFNVSLHSSGTKLIRKKYIHIGVAVATPSGLVVPVVKNADRKTVWEIAEEIGDLGARAKDRKLGKEEMQGACFSVSSLGNLGGTGFTPIVNAPEVAILGVSKTTVKPVYINNEFVPRKILPFSLSYDHRAVNGVDGGLFCNYLAGLLGDIRLLVL